MMTDVRPSAVAGTFYPADPAELRSLVDRLLDRAASPSAGPRPKAIIAPHAGYVYSGPIAARAYRMLAGGESPVRRVVLLGPAHYVYVRGMAAPTSAAFATPLGEVPVDRTAITSLRNRPGVVIADAPHAPEHSLEVHLPFLQRVLGTFALVPLVVGDADPADVVALLDAVWGGPETLIVVSSDLSHYLDQETAQRRDAATAAAIERFDTARLGPEDACGCLPIAGLLTTARRRGMTVQRLDLRTSGDTVGPQHRVVGYGAWALGEGSTAH